MNKSDRQLLLRIARNAIESRFSDSDINIRGADHLTQLRGCFVTIHKNNELRGCIGFARPIMPLYEQVITAAKAAAFEDTRFEPIAKSELKNIAIEISLLTRPELLRVESYKEYLSLIDIGCDGLIIQGEGTGLLLPQVAVEFSFNQEQFLTALCEKAGLDTYAWKNPKNRIYRFRAEIFSEDDNN